MIRHVIMWKFQDDARASMEEFLTKLRGLYGVIPEIKAMQVGVSCKDGNSHDACLIADFDDLDALERYRTDPRHQAVSALCKKIRTDRVAVDFEV